MPAARSHVSPKTRCRSVSDRRGLFSALAAAPTPQLLEGGKRSVAALFERLKPGLTGAVLINSLDAGNTGPHLTRAGYSEEYYRKLVALKDQYDPANVFRFNHNIPPSNGAAKT